MNAWEIVLTVVIGIAFAVALGVIIHNKIKGKGCCDCCSTNIKKANGCDGQCECCAKKMKHEE